MARRLRRRNKRSGSFEIGMDVVGAGALLVLSGFVFISSFSAKSDSAHAEIAMPPGAHEGDYLRYEDPLAVVDALKTSEGLVAAAVLRGRDEIPVVPWGEFGLSNVPIDLAAIQWDPARERYIQTLDDGRIAVLTLDRRTQTRLTDVVARYSEPGEAAVAIEPSTGRVLALVSDGSDARYGRNLALQSDAWAASTFKVITGASLLLNGMANPDTTTCYHGGGAGFTDDLLIDNDELDTLCLSLRRALALSANVIFGKLADRHLSQEKLGATAELLGYNRTIPLEVRVERSHVDMPDDRLEFARSAAGFRHSEMSPLHGALIQAAIANDGAMMVPALVDYVEDSEGMVIWEHEPVIWDQVMTPAEARSMRNMESDTCVNGTARRQFGQRRGWPANIESWGKTGTLSNAEIDGTQPQPAYIYSWFTGFAENGDRQIAVAGLVIQAPSWQIKGSYLASEAVLGYLHGRGAE